MIHFITLLLLGTLSSLTKCESSKDFGIMILYLTGRHPSDYNRYGCWCSTGVSNATHSLPIDETDSCCKMQLECYDRIKAMNISFMTDWKYRTTYYDNKIQCVDFDESPNRELCLCDKRAAECLRGALSTYSSDKKDMSLSSACKPKVNDTILRWDPVGITVVGTTGVAGVAGNLLNIPYGLALDSTNTLYIVDHYNHRVQKWVLGASNGSTVAGQTNGAPGSSDSHLTHPAGIAVDSDGNVFVVDTNNHRVQRWRKDASSGTTVAGVTGMQIQENF
ncbi:unnamed protein product [Rotaria sp. Silwood2]|nr:unnamed protein product [Rotaria sp. Silwood2]CAF4109636.1 unnamed protein product [Rotaria sp. Silwood2]